MVPKLRFKEFCGEWEEKRLGDVYEFKNGLNKEKEFFGKGIPIVNYMDVNKNTHLYKNTIKGRVQLTKKEIENYSAKKGDLFFTRTSETIDEIGYTAVLLDDIEDAVFSGFILRARPKNELIDFKFSGYCFMTREVRKEIIKKSSMTTRALTSGTSLKQVVFYLPSLPEQTKIAHFLCTVDDKIQNQEDKITHLENIKKGFMQKIFSRKIRFKDDVGEEFPEWEEKKLGDIADVRDGTHDSPKYIKDGYPFITSKNLTEDGKVDFSEISYISENDYKKINERSKVEIGDILFGMIGTIGKPVLVDKEGFAIKNVALIKKSEILLNNYLIQYLQTDYIKKQFLLEQAGGTQKFIALSVIRRLKIYLPCLKEQQKIADFLSSFDKKISTEKDILEYLKEIKKGLLQQMFV